MHKARKKSETLPPHPNHRLGELFGIDLFDFGLGQDIEGLTITKAKAGKITRLFYKIMRAENQFEEMEKRQAKEEPLYQAYLKTL
ncbi:MAG: hypothetical protein ACFFB2_19970 [Promethearchaeota archaeon]